MRSKNAPAGLAIQSAGNDSDRLVSNDTPRRIGTLAYGPLEVIAYVPYSVDSPIDTVRLFLDGKQQRPDFLQEFGRMVTTHAGIAVEEIRYRWPCPPLGRHHLQLTYRRDTRWSEYSQPLRFNVLPPTTPEIIAVASRGRQPRPWNQSHAIKVDGSLTLKLSGIEPGDRVAVELENQEFTESVVNQDCCVTANLSKLVPPGRYAITVRRLTATGCGLSSKPSKRLWIDFFDEDAYVTHDDLTKNQLLEFTVQPIHVAQAPEPGPDMVYPMHLVDPNKCESEEERRKGFLGYLGSLGKFLDAPLPAEIASNGDGGEADTLGDTGDENSAEEEIEEDSFAEPADGGEFTEGDAAPLGFSEGDTFEESRPADAGGVPTVTPAPAIEASEDESGLQGKRLQATPRSVLVNKYLDQKVDSQSEADSPSPRAPESRLAALPVLPVAMIQAPAPGGGGVRSPGPSPLAKSIQFPSLNNLDVAQTINVAVQAQVDATRAEAAHLSAVELYKNLSEDARNLNGIAHDLQVKAKGLVDIESARRTEAMQKQATAEQTAELEKIEAAKSNAAQRAAEEARRVYLALLDQSKPFAQAQIVWKEMLAHSNLLDARLIEAKKETRKTAEIAAEADSKRIAAAAAASAALVAARVAKANADDANEKADAARLQQHVLGVQAKARRRFAERAGDVAGQRLEEKRKRLEAEADAAANKKMRFRNPMEAYREVIASTEMVKEWNLRQKSLEDEITRLTVRLKEDSESLLEDKLGVAGATSSVVQQMLDLEDTLREICEADARIANYKENSKLTVDQRKRVEEEQQKWSDEIEKALTLRQNLRDSTASQLQSVFFASQLLDTAASPACSSPSSEAQSLRDELEQKYRARIDDLDSQIELLSLQTYSEDWDGLTEYEFDRALTAMDLNDTMLNSPQIDDVLKLCRFTKIGSATARLSVEAKLDYAKFYIDWRIQDLLLANLSAESEALRGMMGLNTEFELDFHDAEDLARQWVVVAVAKAMVDQRQKELASNNTNLTRTNLGAAKAFFAQAQSDFDALKSKQDALARIAEQQEEIDRLRLAIQKATTSDRKTLVDDLKTAKIKLAGLTATLPETTSQGKAIVERVVRIRARREQIVNLLLSIRDDLVLQLETSKVDRVRFHVLKDRMSKISKSMYIKETEIGRSFRYVSQMEKSWRSYCTLRGAQLKVQLFEVQDKADEHAHRMELAKRIDEIKVANEHAYAAAADDRAKAHWEQVRSRERARRALASNAPDTTTHFHTAAHFPIPRFGNQGRDDEREGMTIAEGMKLVTRADGSYDVEFQVKRMDIPVKLSLQILFQTQENGPWHTLTLEPRVIVRGTRVVRNVAFDQLRPEQFDVHNFVTYRDEGHHPALKEFGGRVVNARRKGNARYGYGFSGLDVYRPIEE